MKLFSAAARLSGAEVTLRGQSARLATITKQLRTQQHKGTAEKITNPRKLLSYLFLSWTLDQEVIRG
jgi:hypothetical protein